MPNKNIQEPISVHLFNLKSVQDQHEKEGLKLDGCECSVCKCKIQTKGEEFQPIQKDENNLQEFIKEFPSIFPLMINPTTLYNPDKSFHMHYYNGNRQDNKFFIFKTKVTKLLSNHSMSSNIQIFGNNFSKITAKHELMSFMRRLEQKPLTSHRRVNTQSKQMTKSLILPSISDSGQTPFVNPESRQENNFSVFSTKYRFSKVLYIQSYTNEIPLKIYYNKKTIESKLDPILHEYLEEEMQNFHLQKPYTINEEFWQWVFTQYGQQVFAHFVTEFYCKAYTFFSKNTIHKAVFYWIFEKPKSEFGQNTKVTEQLGRHKQMLQAQYFISKVKKLAFRLKLGNIKNMTIEYHKNFKSFQEQYQEIILQKIKSKPNENKSILGNKKSYLYQNRLDTFHSKMRDLFLKEQNKVLNQVQTEKQFQGNVDSNKLARLLLPNMGQQHTIREILNDQCAFQKLIMFQEKKIEKERLRKARQQILQDKNDASISKRVFQQSRFKNRQSPSKRIRVRTQF